MISIVIPNLHSPIIDQVVQALEQQRAAEYITEIIIVGQDRFGRVPQHPRVRFVQTPRPTPPSVARNMGARLARGEYVHFLDADCIAHPQLVERLLARYAQGEHVVGGGVVLAGDNYWARCDNLLVFAASLTTEPPGPRFYLPSCSLSIRRDIFLALGCFDERFKLAAGEDYDLSLRLRRQGYRLFCETGASIEHRHLRTTARTMWQHLRAFGREHIKFWEAYPDFLTAGHRIQKLRPWAGVIFALAPLLALRDALKLYAQNASARRAWLLLPGVVWGKLAWYWGIAEALLATPAQQRTREHA